MMNLYKSFNFFKEDMQTFFNPIPVFLEFPKPFREANFPYITLFLITVNRERYKSSKFIEQTRTQNVVNNIFNVGDLIMSLNVQFFSKAGNTKDVYDFKDRFTNYIFKDFVSGDTEIRCLHLKFGSKKYETALVYLNDSQIDQTNSQSINSGFNRIIFDLTLETSEIVSNSIPLVKRVELVDSEVSEDATDLSN